MWPDGMGQDETQRPSTAKASQMAFRSGSGFFSMKNLGASPRCAGRGGSTGAHSKRRARGLSICGREAAMTQHGVSGSRRCS